MSKLRSVLAAAAALIVGGMSVGLALFQAGEAEEMTCKQWRVATERQRDASTHETAFLAIPNGTAIPKAWPDDPDGRVLGNCNAGICTIEPNNCAFPVTYTYSSGPLVNGYRLFEIKAPLYVLGGWRRWAVDTPVVKFFKSFGQIIDACKASPEFTDVQCLNLIDGPNRCLLLSDGNICRYGKEYGPGLGGDVGCHYALTIGAIPCDVNCAGCEMIKANQEFAAEQYDSIVPITIDE